MQSPDPHRSLHPFAYSQHCTVYQVVRSSHELRQLSLDGLCQKSQASSCVSRLCCAPPAHQCHGVCFSQTLLLVCVVAVVSWSGVHHRRSVQLLRSKLCLKRHMALACTDSLLATALHCSYTCHCCLYTGGVTCAGDWSCGQQCQPAAGQPLSSGCSLYIGSPGAGLAAGWQASA